MVAAPVADVKAGRSAKANRTTRLGLSPFCP
jgi:hypothetical protein